MPRRQPDAAGESRPGWAGCMRAVLGAWSAARAGRREQERLWTAAIADAHVLAERGRAMSRDAADEMRGHTGPR